MRIRVLGAGIVGSACALRCAEAGHDVEVVAAATGEQTTSAVAAALWYPYRALPQAAVTRWAGLGFAALTDMASDPPCGVDLRGGWQLFREPTPDPWWREAVPSLARVAAADLPDGYADGLDLTVPVVDMPLHLRWLAGRLAALGVRTEQRMVASLDHAARDVDVLINCAGLGARDLVPGDPLVPVRGQVALVRQFGLDRWVLDESEPEQLIYVVPRRDTVVVGGTALVGDGDEAVRPATAETILRRAAALVPELADATVVSHRVGLRPARPEVRLERDGDVVHCYGHGGAGVTLAYGCARDVVALLE